MAGNFLIVDGVHVNLNRSWEKAKLVIEALFSKDVPRKSGVVYGFDNPDGTRTHVLIRNNEASRVEFPGTTAAPLVNDVDDEND